MRILASILTALALVGATAHAQETAPLTTLAWTTIAGSEIVVTGKVQGDHVTITSVLKGHLEETKIDAYPGRLGKVNGEESVVALNRSKEGWLVWGAERAQERVVAATKAEIEEQTRTIESFPAPRSQPLDPEVARIADDLCRDDEKKVQDAFDALLALAPEAVPAIIRKLDDRRTLHVRSLTRVYDTPCCLGCKDTYRLATVLDALTVVLHLKTPDYSGPSLQEGADEAARDAAVAGWRVYYRRHGF